MHLSNKIIENYFECHYKSHLRIRGIDGEKCNFEKYQFSEALKIKTVFFKEILKTSWNCNDGYESQKLEEFLPLGRNYILNPQILFKDFIFQCDFLKKIPGKSKFGHFVYIPVLILPIGNISRKYKILIAGVAYALNNIQASDIPFAEIVYGQGFKSTHIKVQKHLDDFHKTVNHLKANDN